MRYVLLLLACILTIPAAQAEEINAGFVRGLWYSDDSIFVGDTVRAYVAIRNNTNADLTGTVTFYANDKRIGSQSVAALDGRIIESWVDWEPSYGEQTVRAELSRLKLSTVGAESENVAAAVAAASDTIFVDYDTDGDNRGNGTDEDDDNDGTADTTEVQNSTDPLTPNTPPGAPATKPTETTADTLAETSRSEDTPEPNVNQTGGLERFLTPSRADTLLGNITTWTERAKTSIDTYRNERSDTSTSTTEAITVDSNGFGEITRSTDANATVREPETTSIAARVVAFIGGILAALFDLVLLILSLVFSYAIFIQLLLLIGILAGIYFIAKKLGSRPGIKKKK